jgi:transposase InsO family protein
LGTVSDLVRSKPELMAENAVLRQQLIVLRRSVKRPQLKWRDRLLLVFHASRVRSWKNVLLIVRPETLLRWHRALFRLYWRRKSEARSRQPRVPEATIALIRRMAQENRLWGAERIRGELLKLGIRVSKRTLQRYMARVERRLPSAQTWKTFLQNHAHDIWVCDFLQVYDLFFRSLFVFILIELGSRRVAHVAVTTHPTDGWVAQQVREATPWGEGPKYLIHDQDNKYGIRFERAAAGRNIEAIRLPYRSPNLNAVCERFWGSMRRESLDHLPILNERHLQRIVAD